MSNNNVSPSTTNISINRNTNGTISVQQRYIQASPPYFLGVIQVSTFIFAVIENGKDLLSVEELDSLNRAVNDLESHVKD